MLGEGVDFGFAVGELLGLGRLLGVGDSAGDGLRLLAAVATRGLGLVTEGGTDRARKWIAPSTTAVMPKATAIPANMCNL